MCKKQETAEKLAKQASKALKNVRGVSAITGKAWYLSPVTCGIILSVCAAIDFSGFFTVAAKLTESVTEDATQTFAVPFLAVAGLLAAFEMAPLYMGYALCLKFHGLGKRDSGEQVWKYVLSFSTAAFALGVAVNLCFRFLMFGGQFLPQIVGQIEEGGVPKITQAMSVGEFLWKVASRLANIYSHLKTGGELTVTLGETIVFSLVPVITSLINLTIGCLAFDPLYADVTRLSKKLARLRAQKCWWIAKQKEKEQANYDYLERCDELKKAVDETNFDMLEALTKIAVDGKYRKARRKEEAKRKREAKRRKTPETPERREFQ